VAVGPGHGRNKGQDPGPHQPPPRSRELRHVVAELNSVLRGWGAYFCYGNSNRKFALIDSYVHLRLSKLASVKYATRGRLRASRFNYGWLTELGIYRLTGRVKRWTPAHA
jgi:hypothetical protein